VGIAPLISRRGESPIRSIGFIATTKVVPCYKA
jgi:hypothetical protein